MFIGNSLLFQESARTALVVTRQGRNIL